MNHVDYPALPCTSTSLTPDSCLIFFEIGGPFDARFQRQR